MSHNPHYGIESKNNFSQGYSSCITSNSPREGNDEVLGQVCSGQFTPNLLESTFHFSQAIRVCWTDPGQCVWTVAAVQTVSVWVRHLVASEPAIGALILSSQTRAGVASPSWVIYRAAAQMLMPASEVSVHIERFRKKRQNPGYL